MKKILGEFVRRGLMACGFGPMVLAVVYLVLHGQGMVDSLSVHEVCMGIFSLSALAFAAGGLNVLYQVERLPLMLAILIHGGVLYIGYLSVYLLNGWLQTGMAAFWVFTAVFVLGYLAIWAVIYTITRRNTQKLNEMLKKKNEQA